MTICFVTPSDRGRALRGFLTPVDIDYSKNEAYGGLPVHLRPAFETVALRRVDFPFLLDERESAKRREAAHRLVKASKSPTTDEVLELAHKKHLFKFDELKSCVGYGQDGEIKPLYCFNKKNKIAYVEKSKFKTCDTAEGVQAVIQYREWSDEYRIRTQTEVMKGNKPPLQSGARESVKLSAAAAKKIADSCEYMAKKMGGFRTFVTGTFSADARERIARGETTIQKEVSRVVDAMQKMYVRGWVSEKGEKIKGSDKKLCYVWVVEIPKNKSGGDNPHVHFLMDWRVPFRLFAEWSARLEKLWGHGTFHIEKIKEPEKAGAYMAKAASYLTKAQGMSDQGKVIGNRYGISKDARAPKFETISKSPMGSMGQLISDFYENLTEKFGDYYRLRKDLRKKMDECPKGSAIRRDVGKRLELVRKFISDLPVRCNRYQVILKGIHTAQAFFSWARGESVPVEIHGWVPDRLEPELVWTGAEKCRSFGARYFERFVNLYKKIKMERSIKRNAWGLCDLKNYVDSVMERAWRFKENLLRYFSEYESLNIESN